MSFLSHPRKALGIALVLFGLSSFLYAQEKIVVASTSWTAAFAQAAGARNIRILAPVDLKHPPEYELKPSDLEAVGSADIIIYAGYERFAQKLAETAGSAGLKVLRIATSNKPSELKAEARKIAEALGTVGRFEEWSRNFDSFAADLRTKVLAAYSGRGAVVQRMQRPFVEWLGLDISGEFGPAEPSPAVILQLVRIKPALVIDNYHNPSGRPIAEAAGAAYADLINFPGRDGTKTIEDVFRYNAEILIKAASK